MFSFISCKVLSPKQVIVMEERRSMGQNLFVLIELATKCNDFESLSFIQWTFDIISFHSKKLKQAIHSLARTNECESSRYREIFLVKHFHKFLCILLNSETLI